MPRMKQPPGLACLALQVLGRWLQYMVQHGGDVPFDALFHFLHARLPWGLRDQVAQQLLCAASRAGEGECVAPLVELACRLDLRTVHFSQWPLPVQSLLLANLHRLDRVEEIKTGKDYTIFYTSNKADYLLRAVGKTCAHLEHLEVHYCVSEKPLKALLQCQWLRVVVLRSVDASAKACRRLLLGLPRLEVAEIVTPCREASMVRALKAIQRSGTGASLTALRGLALHVTKQKHLSMVSALCPHLGMLELILGPAYRADSGSFTLPPVAELRLLFPSRTHTPMQKVRRVLEVVGPGLLSLTLSCTDYLAVDLEELSRLCPQLVRLSLTCDDCCSVAAGATLLPRLEHLHVDQKGYDTLYLEPLLRSCPGLRTLSLRFGQSTHCFYSVERVVPSDAMMASVLRSNPLANLEEFAVRGESRLTVATVRLLMASCAQLQLLVINDAWHMSREELTSFREPLRELNMDLGVYYLKYCLPVD